MGEFGALSIKVHVNLQKIVIFKEYQSLTVLSSFTSRQMY